MGHGRYCTNGWGHGRSNDSKIRRERSHVICLYLFKPEKVGWNNGFLLWPLWSVRILSYYPTVARHAKERIYPYTHDRGLGAVNGFAIGFQTWSNGVPNLMGIPSSVKEVWQFHLAAFRNFTNATFLAIEHRWLFQFWPFFSNRKPIYDLTMVGGFSQLS